MRRRHVNNCPPLLNGNLLAAAAIIQQLLQILAKQAEFKRQTTDKQVVAALMR